MKLIRQQAALLPQPEGLEGIYKQIELCGRVCYKSEDKITEDSAKKFVERMIKSKHNAMLEHGTVYLQCRICLNIKDNTPLSKYKNNKYSKCYEHYFPINASKGTYVTTNLRVLVENNWLDDLQYICDPTEFHEKRYTFLLTTSVGLVRELLRHRKFSFANESTRYCNYSKDKFKNEITFIMPKWYEDSKYDSMKLNAFDKYLKDVEELYMYYVDCGMQPQEARDILPLCTKSDLIMTGLYSDWKYFLDLRYKGITGVPHPDMKILAELISKKLNEYEKF